MTKNSAENQRNPPPSSIFLFRVVLIVAIVNSAILHRRTCGKIYFGELFIPLLFFPEILSWRKSCVFTENFRWKADLLCVWFIRHRVHAVAADEFLMAHNTKVKLPAFVDAGIRYRVRSKGFPRIAFPSRIEEELRKDGK